MYGVSYHINNNTYKDAPNKIDDDAVFVYNPGIGIDYEFRDTIDTEGFAFLTKAGYMRDCNNLPVQFFGAGTKYKTLISKKVAFESSFLLLNTRAKDWDTNEYNNVLMPLASIGTYYIFNSNSFGLNMVYIPENTAITATSGTPLLFLYFSYGISFSMH
jgi:hypothetical protein